MPWQPHSKRNFKNAFRLNVPRSRDMPTGRPQGVPAKRPRRPYSKRNFKNVFRIKAPGSRDMPTGRLQGGTLGFIKSFSINSKRNFKNAFRIIVPGSKAGEVMAATVKRLRRKYADRRPWDEVGKKVASSGRKQKPP